MITCPCGFLFYTIKFIARYLITEQWCACKVITRLQGNHNNPVTVAISQQANSRCERRLKKGNKLGSLILCSSALAGQVKACCQEAQQAGERDIKSPGRARIVAATNFKLN